MEKIRDYTKKETLEDYTEEELKELKERNYSYYETVMNNSAKLYYRGGSISDRNNDDKVIGITNEYLKIVIELLQSPKFAYARRRDYGITIYHIDAESPTGVSSVGGISNEFMWLVDSITKTGTLSSSEGLRTAH